MFDDDFTRVFDANFERVARVLGRLSGDAATASDLAQEAFLRLYQRGSLPDSPTAWVISVAMNLFRSSRTTDARRRRLLTVTRGEGAHSDPAPLPGDALLAAETAGDVRKALNTLTDREQQLLLLRAEGYSYKELAAALTISEASVGVMLARAKRAFSNSYDEGTHASN